MKQNGVQQIAEALYDKYPDVDPTRLNFVDLHNKVITLEGSDDDHKRGGGKFLEATQQARIDEAEWAREYVRSLECLNTCA